MTVWFAGLNWTDRSPQAVWLVGLFSCLCIHSLEVCTISHQKSIKLGTQVPGGHDLNLWSSIDKAILVEYYLE